MRALSRRAEVTHTSRVADTLRGLPACRRPRSVLLPRDPGKVSFARIVQIVVSLPPRVDGIGDYAVQLGRGLRERGIDTTFIVGGVRDLNDPPRSVAGFEAFSVERRASAALSDLLSRVGLEVVILHYSGYGYAKRGCPFWLPVGLRDWKKGGRQRRLITVFHELYAISAPWHSAFWLGPFGRGIARTLLGLSDAYVTNITRHRDVLKRWRPDLEASAVLPVFSNVGEPQWLVPVAEREPIAVVFGQPPGRRRVYERFDRFRPILETAGVSQVLDIGPKIDAPIPSNLPVSVVHRGRLEPEEVSRELSRSRFGLLDYPLIVAGKSGSLAAYLAHALVCLNPAGGGKPSDGLRQGVNFLVPDAADVSAFAEPNSLQRLAENGQRWYQQHNQKRTVQAFARIIEGLF